MRSILIVEDEDIIRASLRKLLTREGFDVCDARTIDDALAKYQLNDFALIMTSYASLRSAVDSTRMGAVDYIPKPYDQGAMRNAVKRILNSRERQPGHRYDSPSHASSGMIGSSPAMKQVFNIIHKVASTDATVLILGETGAGKELAARAIHNESQRSQHPLISVNCAAIPETLIEAELFGHRKGAFPGASETRAGLIAAADKGTLFLDEIGELPPAAQARLLRVLQEGAVCPVGSVKSRKVDVRLVAATHRNLKQLCQQGKFREDLFYRINVINLSIPALRERGKDVLEIADHLLRKFAHKLNKTGQALAPDAIQAITSYRWPGNVRQLENSLQRAIILCDPGQPISHDLLGIDLSLIEVSASPTPIQSENDPPAGLSLEDYFTHFVLEHQDAMSETELARKLGISRKCPWERRQKLGIPRRAGASPK